MGMDSVARGIGWRSNTWNGTLAVGNQISAGGSITSGGEFTCGASFGFSWNSRSKLTSPADSSIRLTNNTGTDFNLLQFGGTTNTFPALKRNGNALEVKLADDSAAANINANVLRLSGASSGSTGFFSFGGTTATTIGAAGGASALPATPLGYLICHTGTTQVKIPYYNA